MTSGHHFPEQRVQEFDRADFAFPDNNHCPVALPQRFLVAPIPCLVLFELGPPEVRSGRRICGKAASGMAVPEAAMHEDGCSVLAED